MHITCECLKDDKHKKNHPWLDLACLVFRCPISITLHQYALLTLR